MTPTPVPCRDKRWAPRLGAAITALVGLVNIASALTPDIRWRGHLLLQFEAVETMRMFHAIALPAGAALLLIAPYLLKRRRRALIAAVALLFALGLVNLLKGLDWEEAVLGWATACLLCVGRDAFDVDHDPISLRSAVWRVPLLIGTGLSFAVLGAWTAQPDGAQAVAVATLLAIAYVIFRPLAGPRALPAPAVRNLAADLIKEHGRDTLSFFKLRGDKQLFFSEDGSSFVGYRIEAGVMLLSGDPVGPPAAFGELLKQVREFARVRGLRLGAVGASPRVLPLYEAMGLKTIYLGDEAVIDVQKFSLEGRPIRKVRQSVHRLTKAGYSSELRTLADLEPATLEEIERVLELGRQGAPERGFSMAMDSIRGLHEEDTLFVLARDEEQTIRGVLHFVPCYGRPAVSLSFMRRDPDTPNGLTEFLVTEAVVHLRERGLEEMSLNFATAARFMHSPGKWFEKAIGTIARKLNRFFQIESLYKFNAKFFPRWEPRYFVYEGRLGIFRGFVAAMWAEGQLPKPSLSRG